MIIGNYLTFSFFIISIKENYFLASCGAFKNDICFVRLRQIIVFPVRQCITKILYFVSSYFLYKDMILIDSKTLMDSLKYFDKFMTLFKYNNKT